MEVDVNGDGTIDFDEFKDMMKKQGDDKDPSVELLEAFKLFDKDKDGFISMRELKKVATMMGNSGRHLMIYGTKSGVAPLGDSSRLRGMVLNR